jgi:PTS system galactitol-specific IIB component
MKKILVACGGAVATSTVAADKIRTLCQENNIAVDVQQCRIQEIALRASEVDLIVTTARITTDYGTPVVHGIAFISGINLEATEQKILDALAD